MAWAMTVRGPKASLIEIPNVGHAPTFIHDDQIPGDFEDVCSFCPGEVIGTQYDGVCLLEWILTTLLDELMKIF